MSLPAVDVVVLSLDRQEEIHECIDSVLAQDHPDLHLWVIDQGSEPATITSLRKRAEAGEFGLQECGRIGIAAGRNLGYRLGSAPVIVSLDNDAVLANDGAISAAARMLGEEPRLGVVGFAVHDYHRGGPDMSCWIYPRPVESDFDRSFPAARFCGGAHAVRREAFERAGGYDPEFFFFGEELDLGYALIAQGYTIRYAPQIAVRHKASPEARIDWKSGRFYHNARNMLYLNRKYFGSGRMQLLYAAGYLLKGLLNGVAGQAWRGVRDGIRLGAGISEPQLLDAEALAYVTAHELEPRGGIWRRLRHEVLPRLRPTRAP